MGAFEQAYHSLNAQQRRAVDTVYGPVLVIAGPGTGKTQLLSARVAHILDKTDTSPQNILCLTFTDSGATAMRERLASFIGQHAYDVAIGTYHSFGSTIINRYPEYFTDIRLERPIDELGRHQILAAILESVEYASPIKQLRHHIGDLIHTISEVKRGLLTPDDLRSISTANLTAIATTKHDIAKTLHPFIARMPSKLATALPVFQAIHTTLMAAETYRHTAFPAYSELAALELEAALETAQNEQKTTPLTAWKNRWLVKDDSNEFMLGGTLEAERMIALADILQTYEAALREKGLYDFDDMILMAVDVLEHNDSLRFTLQEQYQFILLDEFQDTNAAQLRLIELLTNNPANERRPNVLAVGDDDQAIYAFQGAEVSNMLDFYRLYDDVEVVSLSENYRSKPEILEAAANIASQIESRLHTHFETIEKTLVARQDTAGQVQLHRQSYASTIAERTAVAEQIAQLIQTGVPASEIAVLAPKHKYLEPLVPYLQARDIAVRYDKRENILDTTVIRQLITTSKLILALHHGAHSIADSLWPEILSYDFWGFSTKDIWQLSWQASDTHRTWSELLLAHAEFKHAALLILTLAGKVETETVEYMLDAIIGTTDIQTNDRGLPSVRSPLREYYFQQSGDTVLYETVTRLTVLRTKLREHQAGEGRILGLSDLVTFTAAYEAAGEQMLDTNPYNQAAEAVNLMTVYKSKGLEFQHVFLLACDDSTWGSRATGVGNKLTIPANLARIRHAGTTDDERLRLLYVAMTRAKYGLHLTSHARLFNGKVTEPIKYFDESRDDTGAIQSGFLPPAFRSVTSDDSAPPSLEALTMNWQHRHINLDIALRTLLQERLKHFQLSPTHLTQFIDLEHAGPQSFLLNTILRFPSAPTVDTLFGNAMHETLQWMQNQRNTTGKLPTQHAVIEYVTRFLSLQPFTEEQRQTQTERATRALRTFLGTYKDYFVSGNVAEKSFREEGVFLGDVHLGGKIDLLQIDSKAKRITVVDYKTGGASNDPAKLHRYSLQLYCYKLLVEGSHTFNTYTVDTGKLIFVEPGTNDKIVEHTITFTHDEVDRVKALLSAMWQHVTELDLPDTTSYGTTFADIKRFESDLLTSSSQ